MRAWIYQLNPSRGRFTTTNHGFVPTTTENLFRYELGGNSPRVGGWYFTNFSHEVKRGDPILIKMGAGKETGIVACGRLSRVWKEGRTKPQPMLSFKADKAGSLRLRANPVPLEWIKSVVPKVQSNLVKLEGHWPLFARQLAKRSVVFDPMERIPTAEVFPEEQTSQTLGREGQRVMIKHLRAERDPANRVLVLAAAPQPYRCEACGMAFGVTYGPGFAKYIQVHHRVPVGAQQRTPKLQDFALLCANCHAVAHWKRATEPLSVEAIRVLLASSVRSGRVAG